MNVVNIHDIEYMALYKGSKALDALTKLSKLELDRVLYRPKDLNGKIKKITIKGTNTAGQFEVDTELMKMKHYLSVAAETVTNEVNSFDFFLKAQEFIEETRNKT